ncbi:MAG: DUF177 domain-containing protein [Actinomycetia bacterium]|nr:DUF177 domain-containing protein [Actinomycetes bacterium]
MEVRVTDVKKWVGREETVPLEGPWPEALAERMEWPIVELSRASVRLQNTGHSVLVALSGDVVVDAECARCTRPFRLTVPFEGTQEFRETEPGPDDDWERYAADTIDLDPLFTDTVLLAMPYAALCREDCRGLCARCGADLNEGPCGCAPPADDRWAALADWRPKPPQPPG